MVGVFRQFEEGHRTMIRILILSLAFALVTFSFIAEPAIAHTKIQKSVPANGEVVDADFSEIKLNFANKLRLTRVTLTHERDDKTSTPVEGLPKGFVTEVSLPIEALEAGAYKLNWTGVAADGHVVKDEIAFTVSAD